MNSNKMQLVVESYFPGRMRIRVPRQYRKPLMMGAAAEALRRASGITAVSNSLKTGSLLLTYDSDVIEVAEIVAILETANFLLDMGIHAGEIALKALEKSSGPTVSKAAEREYSSLKSVDSALHRITGGAVSLRSVLLFVLLAVVAVGIWHEAVAPEKLLQVLKRLIAVA